MGCAFAAVRVFSLTLPLLEHELEFFSYCCSPSTSTRRHFCRPSCSTPAGGSWRLLGKRAHVNEYFFLAFEKIRAPTTLPWRRWIQQRRGSMFPPLSGSEYAR